MAVGMGAGAEGCSDTVGRFTGLTVRDSRELVTLAASPSFAPSRSTIRLFLFFRPRAGNADAANDGDGCEAGDDVPGVLAAPLIFEGLPTATTGGEYATDDGRDEVICSAGGVVR